MRVVTGFGEAGFFVGAATMITDLAPVERRGEAVSLLVGRGLRRARRSGPRSASAARQRPLRLACGSCRPALALRRRAHRAVHGRGRARRAGRAAAAPACTAPRSRPGTVLFLGLIPLAGFTAFVPLYVDAARRRARALIFLLYGVLILVVRIVGARLPDRLGGRDTRHARARARRGRHRHRSPLWPTVAGLVVGTVVFAAGMSLMYPALLLLALDGVERRRARVGRRHVLVVLRRVAGPRRVHLRRGRRGRRATAARSPTGALCALGRARRCCAPRVAARTAAPAPA